MLRGIGRHPGDYWDLIARPSAREAAAASVAVALAERAAAWDVLVASGLPAGAGLPAALVAAGHRVVRRAPSPCPAIDLPDRFDAYEQALPRSHRSNLRRHLRRLDDGEVSLRAVQEPSELDAALERWAELRERQWGAAGRTLAPLHRGPRLPAFLREVTGELAPRGLASVRVFRSAGAVAGVYVDFADARTFYWFLGAFDPSLAGLGLGKIAVAEAIRSSIAAGRRVFDFAHGAEPYKYWFGARDRQSPSVLAGGRRPRAALALGAAALLARARERGGGAA